MGLHLAPPTPKCWSSEECRSPRICLVNIGGPKIQAGELNGLHFAPHNPSVGLVSGVPQNLVNIGGLETQVLPSV